MQHCLSTLNTSTLIGTLHYAGTWRSMSMLHFAMETANNETQNNNLSNDCKPQRQQTRRHRLTQTNTGAKRRQSSSKKGKVRAKKRAEK